jgi:hypothetical protein
MKHSTIIAPDGQTNLGTVACDNFIAAGTAYKMLNRSKMRAYAESLNYFVSFVAE